MALLATKFWDLFLQKSSTQLLRPLSVAAGSRNRKFEEVYSENFIPTNLLQKSLLSLGCAAVSLLDPTRADTIAVFGEASGEQALKYMCNKMKENSEGLDILNEKPIINSKTINLDYLRNLAPNTFGAKYISFLDSNDVTPDSRLLVQFVNDVELAYVMQRYREAHDMIHTILNMPTNMLGEVAVKWVEGIQTRLPMCIGGALFGPLRFKPKQREQYVKYYLPWAIKTGKNSKFLLNVYWEKRWEQPIDDLLRELNINLLLLE